MKTKTRRVITRSGAHVRGYFNSDKSTSPRLPWESSLERDALLIWDFDHKVISIASHQSEVNIENGVESFRTYPDFTLTYRDGDECVVEVKGEADLAREAVAHRLALIKRHFETEGKRYEVMSESEIRQQPRLANLYHLLAVRRRQIRAELSACHRTQAILRNCIHRSLTLGELAHQIGSMHMAERLLANGFVWTDWHLPLTQHSAVTVNTEDMPC